MTRRQTSIRTAVAAIALLGLLPVPAPAQERPAAQGGADLAQLEQQVPTAPVMIDGVEVLRVRGITSFPADAARQDDR